LQNPVSVCACNDAFRSSAASGFILAQPINSVEVAKLAFCNWLNNPEKQAALCFSGLF
jgi:hypothetical protein